MKLSKLKQKSLILRR